ncbi:helix-turn-helix domain-containing protein [Alkaliphilus sp. B6464]|uniref:helix-turn-helix domain-containing protein n=1 Tax=Alkaliphilus sp. B6464 TaxID=2731219 RepID=UPI001BAA0DA8|nr:helix-turn-helix transcriptional regulator [Alkaliphilus sp. B6464]QUH20245.1 helix-turn-helix transcriptional regulator [Alkaliphilus sp. B6464]
MIGENLRKIRESKSLGVNQLSRMSGINASYISNLENNKRKNPSIETLQKIADALEVSVYDFFKDNINNKNVNKNEKTIESDLPIVPEEFTDADEARAYVDKHQIFGSDGFDADRLDDVEILEFANALLEQMRMVSYKYKK